ncbi:MAG TPA: nuclear transport factor 2 family protein [Acidimicrobiia bacterium]|nr:nuclear transport factor 2 family protein [Acidimicrobiia bacterium]
MRKGATQMAEPSEVIEAVRDAYRSGDAEALLSHFVEDAHVIGTKGGESWTNRGDVMRALRSDFGLNEVHGQLAEGTVAENSATSDIQVEGNLAWVAMEGRFDFGGRSYPGRWTCVMRNFDGDWKIVHSHFSVPEGVKVP